MCPRRVAAPVLLLALIACPSPEEPEPEAAATVIEAWCDTLRGGLGGSDDEIVGFSRAVSTARFFAVDASERRNSTDLLQSLMEASPGLDALERFASLGEDRCVAPASAATLAPAEVELRGDVAILTPGSGALSLPAGAEAVIVDLTDLPASPEADAALDAAVGLAFAEDVRVGERGVRHFDGWAMSSEPNSAYTVQNIVVSDSIVATGGRDLPLAFVVGERISPHAARVAAVLRAERRAFVFGYDIHRAVAESAWVGVGDSGLGVVTSPIVLNGGEGLPEVVPADTATFWPSLRIEGLSGSGRPLELSLERVAREPAEWQAGAYVPQPGVGVPASQAMLIEAHGLLDRFFPYFDEVGRGVDDALLDELVAVEDLEPTDRVGATHSLGRLMHAVEDGHGFFGDMSRPSPAGYVGITGDRVGDELLVRHAVPGIGIVPGDTITSVDGEPVADWYAEVTSRHSAASIGYLWNLATRELNAIPRDGQRQLGVRRADGSTAVIDAVPQDQEAYFELPQGGVLRPNGYLDDLDEGEVYYLNLSDDVTFEAAQLTAAMDDLRSRDARAVIVDMRGYPGINHYAVLPNLVPGPFSSPQFVVPQWYGPDVFEWDVSSYDFEGRSDAFDGPIVLLVGNASVSAAENFSSMLTPRPDTLVVGRQSASTNGNITRSFLTGGYYTLFTGMKIRTPDGDDFHGIGIVPDVEVIADAASVAAGRDPELEAALRALE